MAMLASSPRHAPSHKIKQEVVDDDSDIHMDTAERPQTAVETWQPSPEFTAAVQAARDAAAQKKSMNVTKDPWEFMLRARALHEDENESHNRSMDEAKAFIDGFMERAFKWERTAEKLRRETEVLVREKEILARQEAGVTRTNEVLEGDKAVLLQALSIALHRIDAWKMELSEEKERSDRLAKMLEDERAKRSALS